MPLTPQTLTDSLSVFMDQEHPSFTAFPLGGPDFAAQYSQAVADYAAGVVPPSTAVTGAKAAMEAEILAYYNQPSGLVAGLPLAFNAFALALSAGMAPAFAGTPPPTLINFSNCYAAGMAGGSNETCISLMVGIVDAWFRTGLAVNVSSSATSNWN